MTAMRKCRSSWDFSTCGYPAPEIPEPGVSETSARAGVRENGVRLGSWCHGRHGRGRHYCRNTGGEGLRAVKPATASCNVDTARSGPGPPGSRGGVGSPLSPRDSRGALLGRTGTGFLISKKTPSFSSLNTEAKPPRPPAQRC